MEIAILLVIASGLCLEPGHRRMSTFVAQHSRIAIPLCLSGSPGGVPRGGARRAEGASPVGQPYRDGPRSRRPVDGDHHAASHRVPLLHL